MKTTLYFFTALMLLALTGCTDEDEPRLETPFVVESLHYYSDINSETDGITEYDVEISPFVYENKTDQAVNIAIDPYPDELITVSWTSDDPQAFGWEGSSDLYLYRPTMYFSSLVNDINEKMKIPYRQGEYTYESNLVEEEKLTVAPRSRLVLQGSVTHRHIQATYLLTIRREFPEEMRTIRGTVIYDRPIQRNFIITETPLP